MEPVIRFFSEPSLSKKIVRTIIRNCSLGSYEFRYRIDALHRPNYAYLVYQAAKLAYRLGEARVSVIEFGVAGGSGLLNMEYHAAEVEKIFPVKIEIYGFDTGRGLPAPIDYRDLPYHWKPRFFAMNQKVLRERLKRATLILGDVRETASAFFQTYEPAPIGAVSQDLDFYSSTQATIPIFEHVNKCLPRVFFYFDDVIGGDVELYNDYTGERAVINEFNASHQYSKFSPLYYLAAQQVTQQWHHQMWSLHHFGHPQYQTFVGDDNQQLPINLR